MELNMEKDDLYDILGIEPISTNEEIKKAYRKKALKCHPDKNPDNPNAAIEFHHLTKILEILTDEAARKAYDTVLKGRKEAALRHKELSSKRQKLKDDLEERERGRGAAKKSADQILKEEIERLRKEGSKQVEEEQEYVRQQLFKQREDVEENCSSFRIKIKWKAEKKDPNNGGYNRENLQKFLSKYGDVTTLVISPKKTGSALVEFNSERAAEMAVEIEKGLSENPLVITWVSNPKRSTSSTIKDSDFESVTLMKLRQAEERKRLIEEMMKEEQEDD